jgi:hypothetical protein
MTPDRRNTSVVITLVTSMTVGVLVLLGLESWLFPEAPRWRGNISLAAERGSRVEVEVSYADSWADVAPAVFESGDSICVVDADGQVHWEGRGPSVRLVVLGSNGAGSPEHPGAALNEEQKKALLATLGKLSQDNRLELVPVRYNSDLSPQADDLREFLVRKGIIE